MTNDLLARLRDAEISSRCRGHDVAADLFADVTAALLASQVREKGLREALEEVLATIDDGRFRALWARALNEVETYRGPRFDVEAIRQALLPTQGQEENET